MKNIVFGYNLRREGFEELEKNFRLFFPEKEYFKKEELLERIGEADVLIPSFAFSTDKEIIDAGKNLKLIANFGVGYNNIDVDYAAKKGIVVTNTPHSVLEPTAELCFTLLSATARRIAFYDRHLRSPEGISWKLYDHLSVSLFGKTLGIYGMGRIGQAVARRAVASGMKIIYHNRKQLDKATEQKYNAQYVSFEELIRQSDFISLNAPATPETYHLIGETELNQMKKTAILINTARGTLIDEQALIKALKEKQILAAGLDVFENEPRISSELLKLENVTLTPHTGTQTMEGRIAMQKEVAKNIYNFFNNKEISRVN